MHPSGKYWYFHMGWNSSLFFGVMSLIDMIILHKFLCFSLLLSSNQLKICKHNLRNQRMERLQCLHTLMKRSYKIQSQSDELILLLMDVATGGRSRNLLRKFLTDLPIRSQR